MIYVFSPVNSVTGGVELLHQLVYKLRENKKESNIVYLPTNFKNMFTYRRYRTPNLYLKYVPDNKVKFTDNMDNAVVVPETLVWKLNDIKYAKKYLWWLSIDFYFVANKKRFNKFKMKGKQIDLSRLEVIHLVQSYYAYEWLVEQGVDKKKILFLSDYLRSDFIEQTKMESLKEKKSQILYNPKKGLEFTKKILEKCPYVAIPLQNFTPQEMIQIMQESKVYIDFGNHPGKDRIPREAVMCGCCVITGRQGAAANEFDIPIDVTYKFEDKETSINEIVECIDKIFKNYSEYRKEFDNYRKIIKTEEEVFNNQIKCIFEVLTGESDES